MLITIDILVYSVFCVTGMLLLNRSRMMKILVDRVGFRNRSAVKNEFNIIVEASADAIISKDKDGIIKSWNKAATTILGYTAEEVIGRSILLIFPDENEQEEKYLLECIAGENSFIRFETKRRRKDGQLIDVSITLAAIKNESGELIGGVKVLRDITVIKAAEAKIKEQSERLKQATFNSKIGIWEYDLSTNSMFWDDVMYSINGISLQNESTLYQSWLNSIHPDDIEKTEQDIQMAIENEMPFDAEYRIVLPDQSIRTLRARAVVIPSLKNRQPGKMIGTNWDVTQEKLQEEKLRNYEILQKKSKEMEQFTYAASHDLREPLLTIKNYSGLLLEDYKDQLDEEGLFSLNAVNSSAERMDKLIKGLLDYTRLSARLDLIFSDSGRLMREVMDDMAGLIRSSGTIITLDEMPALALHPLQFKQLIQNLIQNAIKFRRLGVQPKIHISVFKQQKGYQFSVSDNGIGIPEKSLESIFIIFKKLHHGEAYEGTGIGLAICKKIIEMHMGDIWAENNTDGGATFHFTINTDWHEIH